MGNIGLLKAIDTYDIANGAAFSTYATKCIKTEIIKFLKTLKEIKYEDSINGVIFYNNAGQAIPYEDMFFDDSNITKDYENIETIIIIRKLIAQLPEREREIIKLYYGFYNDKRYSQREIGELFNVTSQRISCILSKNIKQLSEQLKATEDIEKIKKVRAKRG